MSKPHVIGDFLHRTDGASESEIKQIVRHKVESDITDLGFNLDEYNFEFVLKDETIGYKGTLKEEYR